VPNNEPVNNNPSPVNQAPQDPVIITNDFTNVRRGPGLAYEVSHVLSAGTTAPILGRNNDDSWWAVPGPGDGPGPVGWISGAVVAVQGDLSGVPILHAPPLTPDVPIMGNSGPPPSGDTCVVAHPGPNDLGPTYLRQGAGDSFDAVAILGLNRWAAIVEAQSGWYRVQDANGVTGWVHQSEVAFAGRCSAPGSGPDLPIVEDPGSPPSNTCIANRPGQFPPPGIHLGPGRQFALVARLGNWAEVLKTEAGWHQILLGPGDVGWISDDDVDLTGPCAVPEPIPERIQFAPGETSITLEGMLEPSQRDLYLFRSFAGQRATIEIVAEFNQANFALSGMSDGQPYKRVEDELHSWSAELPTTQDYLLTVAVPADATTTGYRIFLTIEPLP
jgi:SH3-like domain-containing protein